METINTLLNQISGFLSIPMVVLILGVGLFLFTRLRLMTLKRIAFGFRLLWRGRKPESKDGDVSPFSALATSLSATVGTGNIAGVATAIVLGGPGALFWMWMTALVGMATKYSEAVCAVHYRVKDENGRYQGGPMYYIERGMGANWKWMAILFALFAGVAGFGIGNMVQTNSIADALNTSFAIPEWISGVVLLVLVGLVLIGGIKRIATVASALVPLMTILYILAALLVVIINIGEIPSAFRLIFVHAFSPIAATGGFAGAAVAAAIRFGVARGIFSNEAGLGSSPIAHAAAQTKGPVNQGLIAMLGTFIDTIIICTLTGLAILTSGVWNSGVSGATLTADAFEATFAGGNLVISLTLTVFAFTTILGWSYYSERSFQYLFGTRKVVLPFRVVWIIAAMIGTTLKLEFIWILADVLNVLMAIPNLVALLVLSPLIIKVTKDFFESRGKSEGTQYDFF